MKSITKWLAGIFLACSLILSFSTPFEKALTLNLLLLYFIATAVVMIVIGYHYPAVQIHGVDHVSPAGHAGFDNQEAGVISKPDSVSMPFLSPIPVMMRRKPRRSQSGTVSFPVVFVCSSFQIQNVQENTNFSESL